MWFVFASPLETLNTIFWLFYEKRSTPWWILPQANARLLAMSFTSQSYFFPSPMMTTFFPSPMISPCERTSNRRTCRKGRQNDPQTRSGESMRPKIVYIEGQKLSMMTGICFAAERSEAATIMRRILWQIKTIDNYSRNTCFHH